MSSCFVTVAFGGIFWILCKFLPISLEPRWFCTLALKCKPPDFLQKSVLDPQHVISSLNGWGKNRNLHRLGASGSFHALSFHAGLESSVINSKNEKKVRPSFGVILYHLDAWKNSDIENSSFIKVVASQKNPISHSENKKALFCEEIFL
jgi:hypothetical protein